MSALTRGEVPAVTLSGDKAWPLDRVSSTLVLVPQAEPPERPRNLRELVQDVEDIADLVDKLDRENELTPELTVELQHVLIAAIAGTKQKVDRTSGVLWMLETMETAAETEIGRLTRRAAKFRRDRERLESYVLAVLDASKLTKIDGETSTLAKRNNPAKLIVDDPSAIPWDFMRLPEPPPPPDAVPDSPKIKAALKGNPAAVPGCRLLQGSRLVRS